MVHHWLDDKKISKNLARCQCVSNKVVGCWLLNVGCWLLNVALFANASPWIIGSYDFAT